MTATMIKMAKSRITPISFIWVAILLAASSRSENIPRITDLGCLNDFQKKMFCFWEVNSNINCSKEFALSYTDFKETKEKCLDLHNAQLGGSVVPNKCACNIAVKHFAVEESYDIVVESHGEAVANTTVHIGSTIKPRAPSDVHVNFQEEQHGVVQWDTGYKSTFIKDNLSFQVQIICKRTRKVIIEYMVPQTNPEYQFNKRQLKRGENYLVRVRTIPVKQLQGAWSEWSPEAEWRNDYSLTILDLMDIIIPIICIVILCLIIVSYVCLTRYKKKWWDTIPNPANSLIVKKKRIQKHQSIPDRKRAATKSCGSFFSKIVKAHKSKCDQLTQHDSVRHYVIDIISSDGRKYIFEPKMEDIETYFEMHPKSEDENKPVEESKPEHKAEDHLLEEDLSIADMFFAILCDSSSTKVNRFENLNMGLFDCSAVMDTFDKEEKQQSNLKVSGRRKMEYHNYDSSDSPVESSFQIDAVKMPSFIRSVDNEIDRISYTPQASNKEDCSKKTKGGPLTSPKYNSFTNAVSEARQDFIIDTSKTFCPDNSSRSTVLEKTNIYEQQLSSMGILNLCSYRNSYQPKIKPNSVQIVLQCHESKTCPTSIYQVSGYQSFDQAVQENEPELGCHMSGYKDFDQAVRQSDETFVSEMNQYQSFDQAIQENGPGSECHLSGCKMFDQTVQEGDDTSVHEVNVYQSFNQAVCQGDETFVSEMNQYQSFAEAVQEHCLVSGCNLSGYKSFDQTVQESEDTSVHEVNVYQSFAQAVQENCLVSECHLSGYKSFDQTIQEGNDTSVHEVNAYQSFNQAAQAETLGSKNCSILDSGYKPFESVRSQNHDYSDKNVYICKNDHLGDKSFETNTNFDNSLEYRLPSSNIMELIYSDFAKSTKKTYQSFSDKSINALKIVVGVNNDMALKHDGIPLALTFDICEHLRNFENMHGYKVPLINLKNGTTPINEALFLCHLDKVSSSKNVTFPKCPSTSTFENMSFLMPMYDLDNLHSSQTTKHLLIQQSSYDKDGNSYMKIK